MTADQDQIDRRLNDFATRSFRDLADGDYIAARMACRAGLFPQFMWSAQQAIEKYLKCILLLNRVEATGVGHDIAEAIGLLERLPFAVVIRPKGRELVDHLARYGQYRYLDVPYFLEGPSLFQLDMAVWDLRRYCQVIDVFGKVLPEAEQRLLERAQAELRASDQNPPHTFRLRGGLLEKVLDDKRHPARSPLVWQNGFFSAKARSKVKVWRNFHAANSPLWLFPQMLDELLKFVWIPKGLVAAYRGHLSAILADPSKAP